MSAPRTDRGQALVECLVAMLVLVPMLAFVVGLSQVQASQQTAQATAWAGALAAHHGIDTARLPARSRAAALEVSVVLQSGAPSLAAQRTEDIAFGLLQPALAVGSGRFDLLRLGSQRATAATRRREDMTSIWSGPARWSAQRAEISVLLDDGAASDAATVHRRTAALSTAGRIAAWRPALQWALEPMRLFEPAVAGLCLGRIDPDIVPLDRLPGLPAASSDLRTRRC